MPVAQAAERDRASAGVLPSGDHEPDDKRLLVVDKEWGRSKSDSVNAGLDVASSPYICVVDADAVLENDTLLRIMGPVLTDPRPVIAAGGIVRVANGSRIEGGNCWMCACRGGRWRSCRSLSICALF